VFRKFGSEVSEMKNLGRISSSGLESLLRSYASPQSNRGVSRYSGHRFWIAAFPFTPTPESKVVIYAPKESFGVYDADLPSSFYRKDPSLPPNKRYYVSPTSHPSSRLR
jgi:hypothetical protein